LRGPWVEARVSIFAATEERLATPMAALDGITVHSLPIEPAIMAELKAHPRRRQGAFQAAENRGPDAPVLSQLCASCDGLGFRTLFAHLLGDDAPLVIHCTAGQGIAPALPRRLFSARWVFRRISSSTIIS